MAQAGFTPNDFDFCIKYREATNANLADCTLFCAPFPCEILYIVECHGTKGSNGSAVTIVPRKCTGTTALASGTALLVTAFDAKSTNLIPVVGVLSSTRATRTFATGDRFVLDFTGTLTALADVNVTAWFRRTGF